MEYGIELTEIKGFLCPSLISFHRLPEKHKDLYGLVTCIPLTDVIISTFHLLIKVQLRERKQKPIQVCLDKCVITALVRRYGICGNYIFMNSMKTCPSVTFYFMKISFSDIDRKWILLNMIRALSGSHSLSWSIHTKDESKRETAFAFIFGVN